MPFPEFSNRIYLFFYSAIYRASSVKIQFLGRRIIQMRNATIFLLAAVLAFGFVFTGCKTDSDDDPGDTGDTDAVHAAYGNPIFTGEVDGHAQSSNLTEYIEGHAASIDITLTLEEGYITQVDFEQTGHTPTIGGPIIEKAKTQIVEWNKIAIDVVTGVSVTPKLINRAGQDALAKIPGYEPD
jgi:hypothetical protein